METKYEYGTFENEWLTSSVELPNNFIWKMSDQAQTEILNAEYSIEAFHTMQARAIERLLPIIGDRPHVALSGGIDSQATCLLLKNAGVNFTANIMMFPDGLNKHDVESALTFCSQNRISYKLVSFDILPFLGRELNRYVEKYDCPSPQLSAHCRFYEMLMEQYSPSAIICGGNPPCIREGSWEFISNRSHSVWMQFAKHNKYPLIGNFLGFSLDMALPFMIMQPDMPKDAAERYQAKVTGMRRMGLNVIPQKQKFTGFELVKEHFAKMSGDGWTFEKWFRLPHHKKRPEYDSLLELPESISGFLTTQHAVFNPQ